VRIKWPLTAQSEVNGKNMNDVFAWLKLQDAKGKSVAPIKWCVDSMSEAV